MDYTALLKSLETLSMAQAISEGEVLFPWLESIHVLAIVLVVGVIATVDLRLLGWASKNRAVNELSTELLPLTWIAFAVAAITGALLFISKANVYGHNFFFIGKMVLLVLAGLNMAYFHRVTWPGVAHWGETPLTTPAAAKVAGGLSLLFWVTIVAFGRWIGFTT